MAEMKTGGPVPTSRASRRRPTTTTGDNNDNKGGNNTQTRGAGKEKRWAGRGRPNPEQENNKVNPIPNETRTERTYQLSSTTGDSPVWNPFDFPLTSPPGGMP